MEAIRDACPGAWLIIGDFNLILEESNKNNARINRRNLRNFRHTVAMLELLDLHLHARSYTWSNEQDSPILIKLDHALVSVDWEEQFPNCFLQALSSDASDHCPLLLCTSAAYHPKLHFHFDCFWLKLEGYKDAIT
uniref:Endonuclease/exonuclease/phosphatase domain-containing protein n=1 Tax=Setaria viridis TaxID=4556 RepID=A0A4U6UB12_SETVI|nr:hypothetical protein SEVIR_6G182800v2 [Setaria viridis]